MYSNYFNKSYKLIYQFLAVAANGNKKIKQFTIKYIVVHTITVFV